MFSLRLSVSARALSWRFLFLFVEVQARDNSEKQEASAVLFPSWSPATKGKKKKTNQNQQKPQNPGLCRYFVQVETVNLNAVPLPASSSHSACHQGPKGHTASAIGSAQPPHTGTRALQPQLPASLEESTSQPGTELFCCQMLLHPLQEK